MLIAAVVILVLLVFFIVAMYNGLVSLKVQCDNAWSDIDVQLKRRYDLIPNLIETVKGYAAHEKAKGPPPKPKRKALSPPRCARCSR